jgi:hypothetical protein
MENTMSKTPKRQFTLEYRVEAGKLVTAQGMKVVLAAQKLGCSM